MKTAKIVASNTFYQLAGKIVTMSITVLVTIIVTKTYGRVGYGEFNIMQTFPALFFIVADFGINAIVAKEISEKWEMANKYFGNVLLLRGSLSMLLMFVAAFVLYFLPYDSKLKLGILLGLFLIVTQSLFSTLNIIFQVKHRYDLSTIGNLFGSLFILVLVLLFSYVGFGVMWVNFSYICGGLLTIFINYNFLRKFNLRICYKFDFTYTKKLLLLSLPIGLMFVFSQINFRADSFLLSVMKLPTHLNLSNTESVAIYGLPYKVFEVLLVVPTFFMNSIYPVFIKHMTESKEKLWNTFKKSIQMLFLAGLFLGTLGSLFSLQVINLLGGAEFSDSVLVLKLLLSGIVFFYLTQPISWLIVTLGGQKRLPVVYLTSAVFNVLTNLLLIPRYSFYASAVLTWISEIIILLFLIFIAKKTWKNYYA